MKKAILILTMAVALTGCLEKDVTQTLYLEADGSVTWEVLERNVYSSSDSAVERAREEREYFELAMAGRPTILDALAEIGGTDLRSEFLREQRPYSLRATARFKDLRAALEGLFEAAEIDAEVELVADGERRLLTLTAADVDPESAATAGDDAGLLELLASDDLRFVLAAGEFDLADGFSIEDGGLTAVLTGEPAEDADGAGRTRARLGWIVETAGD